MDVKVGDKVVFKRGYDAEEVILDGGEYLLMSESSIIGIEA
jgi:chaperonin GroES